MPRGDEEDVSGDEEAEEKERVRRANVRPELAQLEDEDELNLDEPDPEPVGLTRVRDDYEDDEDTLHQGLTTVSTYIVPIILAGPFYIFNVWRACHWVMHRLVSLPLDFIVTPLETSRTVRKTGNALGWALKQVFKYGAIPLTLYLGWMICPGVLKPNLLNIYFPWVPPYTDIQYEGWIKDFYAQQVRLPQGPGGNVMRTGTRV